MTALSRTPTVDAALAEAACSGVWRAVLPVVSMTVARRYLHANRDRARLRLVSEDARTWTVEGRAWQPDADGTDFTGPPPQARGAHLESLLAVRGWPLRVAAATTTIPATRLRAIIDGARPTPAEDRALAATFPTWRTLRPLSREAV